MTDMIVAAQFDGRALLLLLTLVALATYSMIPPNDNA